MSLSKSHMVTAIGFKKTVVSLGEKNYSDGEWHCPVVDCKWSIARVVTD
jgi:hypothetical protein